MIYAQAILKEVSSIPHTIQNCRGWGLPARSCLAVAGGSSPVKGFEFWIVMFCYGMLYALCFFLFSTDSFLKPRETKVLNASSGGKRATRSPSLISVYRVAPRPFTIIILILSSGRPSRGSRSSTLDPEVSSNSNSWHPSPASFLKSPPKRTVIRMAVSIRCSIFN